MLASAFTRHAHKHGIQIFPGAEMPFLSAGHADLAEHVAVLDDGKYRYDKHFPIHGEAIQWMRKTIRKHPKEITLLAIGPLTNIGALFAADQEIPGLLKGLVIMCGDFSPDSHTPEWNAIADPYAAALVYNSASKFSPGCRFRSVGVDVSAQVRMEKESFLNRCKSSPHLQIIYEGQDFFLKDTGIVTFNDPLAAMIVLNDGLCEFDRGSVHVVIKEEDDSVHGRTIFNRDGGACEITVNVNSAKAIDHFFKTVDQPINRF